jgi:membrane protease YdiL (CAAX protease family)
MLHLKKRIIIFTIIVFLCGWLGKIIDLMLVGQPKGQSLGLLIWLIMPFITSIVLAFVHKSSYKVLGLKPRLKGNGKWYVVSFCLFPLIAIITIGMGLITKSIDTTGFELSGFAATLFGWFIYSFFRAILEETAWRGFLQERLIFLKVNDWLIYFITALVWSIWHIPYYLFFFEGNGVKMIVSCFIILFSWSILYAEIYRVTRTIWPCVLLHATSNAIQYTMLEQYLVINEKRNFIFSPTESIVACAIAILLGLIIRRHRIYKLKTNL